MHVTDAAAAELMRVSSRNELIDERIRRCMSDVSDDDVQAAC